MLADLGAQFVLLGHSERRQYFGENNETLSAKLNNALAAGLTPILCVGETLAQRQAAQEQAVVAEQLSVLRGKAMPHIAVAYEPVWAIGTGKSANAEQIEGVLNFIRSWRDGRAFQSFRHPAASACSDRLISKRRLRFV